MGKTFKLKKRDDGTGLLYFDLPGEKVNKFSTAVMQELKEVTSELKSEKLKCLLLMSAKKGVFIAGADVSEIRDMTDAKQAYNAGRQGQEVFKSFGDLPYPTIAVIDGACMGGGLEISLACTYRVASDSPKTKIAFPEVNLGILPAWGGCTRLPRLIGIQRALDIILTGRSLSAKRALRSGVIDKIIAAEWAEEKALQFAAEIIAGKGGGYKSKREQGFAVATMEKTSVGRNIIFSQAEKMVLKKSGGKYPAPLKALKVIKDGFGKSLEEGFELEAQALSELIPSPISKNLVQIYFWTEEVKKENGIGTSKAKAHDVNKAGVLGAGVMGGGIAQLFASIGVDTRVKDINYDAVAKAYQQAANVLKEKVKKRRLSKEKYREIMLRISGTTDYTGFANTDLVVEAIVENLDIKRSVLSELEENVSKNTIIASNTSSLLIDDMATALKNKKRFVGMHFFNPVHRMPLVEVVRGKDTSNAAVATVYNLCKRAGKTPIVVNDGPGFLVNRLLLPYMVEAVSLLEEGHSLLNLDRIMRQFGMPMGPMELFDEVGIDVAHKVAKILQASMGDRMAESDLLDKLVAAKRLGKKTSIGFYKYDDNKKVFDPEVEKLIALKNKTILSDDDIQKRMVFPMINEAARCLTDEIVSTPRDVDLGMIFGTGFAPFRGGLLKYADSIGLAAVLKGLTDFEKRFGARFKPSGALNEFEKSGGFYK